MTHDQPSPLPARDCPGSPAAACVAPAPSEGDGAAPAAPREAGLCAGLERVPTSSEMNAWDAESVRLGIPDAVLMENAARAALGVLAREHGDLAFARVLLFMGSGNNGGDAACLARHLLDRGARPLVVHTAPLSRAKGSALVHLEAARACGVPFLPLEEWDPTTLASHDILVDGLLGTGFRGTLRENLAALVADINARFHGFVLALDIPSGLDSLTGLPCPVAVKAHATATFAAAKPGLVLPHARAFTGRLHVCDIATPRMARETLPCSYRLLSPATVASLLEARRRAGKGCPIDPLPSGHKNGYGHVLVMGGAHGMYGAAHLAGIAALRGGAGLVTVASPAAGMAAVRGGSAELMTRALHAHAGDGKGKDWPAGDIAAGQLSDLLGKAAAALVGPGMGRRDDTEGFLSFLLGLGRRPPLVVDADALTVLGRRTDLLAKLRATDIITPHPGEAAALLGVPTAEVAGDRMGAVAALAAATPAAVLLKGAGSLVAQQGSPVCICPLDVPQLSCAGSGDVLGGLCAALLARLAPAAAADPAAAGSTPALDALALAVAAHACAGALLAGSHPLRGCLAGEIADTLPSALAALAGEAPDGPADGACGEPFRLPDGGIEVEVPWALA